MASILHVSQPTDGGTAVVVRELVRHGIAEGHHVLVACPEDGPLAGWVQELGAEWCALDVGRQPSVTDLRLVGTVRKLAKRVDVLHLHSSKAGAIGRLAAITLRRSRPRVIFTPHGWSWYVGGRAAGVYAAVEKRLAPVADLIIAVSERELPDGRLVLGPRADLRFIANGVSLETFTPAGPTAERATSPLLVQVGRLSRQKGQDRAVRALARSSHQDARLRLVGDGPDAKDLADLAVRLGVESRVEFVDNTDPRPHLRAADVVVLPSRWEGMPLAMLEAMALGKPIVATDFGGSDALSGVGIIVSGPSEGDIVERLAGEIDQLIDSDSRRVELGVSSRQRCEDRYDLRVTANEYSRAWRGRP